MFGCCFLPIYFVYIFFAQSLIYLHPLSFLALSGWKKFFFDFGSYYRKLIVTYDGLKSAEDINFITLSNMIDAGKHVLAMVLN